MNVRERYDEFPDPPTASSPIGLESIAPLDDGAHFGWAWYRYRSCYRESDGIRILDAGCGTGVSSLGLARLNPSANVVGVDCSAKSLEVAAERLRHAKESRVEFREHDLVAPIPSSWGLFDYVVCRGVLGVGQDDALILRGLAGSLHPKGLLQVTFPSGAGRMPARQLRRAVEAIVPKGADLTERAAVGIELLRSLRSDHPIKRYDAAVVGDGAQSTEKFIAAYLSGEELDWTLERAVALLESAGLKFLYAAERHPWSPDRIFTNQVPRSLAERVERAEEHGLTALRDALDITLHLNEYRLFACAPGHEPRVPEWPEKRESDPTSFARLIPKKTGLATPVAGEDPARARSAVTYLTVTGARGEIDRVAHNALELVDGRRGIATIDAMVGENGGVVEEPEARAVRWLDLAALGFIMLESPDRRQHVDCARLGSIVDRLDCACPRRWVRKCEIHEHCSISPVAPDDGARRAYDAALERLGTDRIATCDGCADYTADPPAS